MAAPYNPESDTLMSRVTIDFLHGYMRECRSRMPNLEELHNDSLRVRTRMTQVGDHCRLPRILEIRSLLTEAITLIQQAVSTAMDFEALLTEQTELEARCVRLEVDRGLAREARIPFDDEVYAKMMMRWYVFEDVELKPLFHLALDSSAESWTKWERAQDLFAEMVAEIRQDERYEGRLRVARQI